MTTYNSVNWREWHWPWWNQDSVTEYDIPVYSHFAGIGPFQWHWYSVHKGWQAWLEV